MKLRIQQLGWVAALVTPGASITLLGVLQSYPELSTLNSYINNGNSSNATSLLTNANNFTFLAPSNDAIQKLIKSNPGALTEDLLQANIQYSLLHGGYPSLSFSNTSQFVASNLVNASYANVTGGQAVELVLGNDGTPQVVTGNKSISTSSSTEIVCTGGIIHIIDEVLSVPIQAVLEITAANLEYVISILNIGGYLNTANVGYVNGVLEVPDVTYFLPNSEAALANATKLVQNSTSEELQALFQYHVVPNFVGYSPLLTNGMSLKTAQGDNVNINIQGGDIYVNAAKVIATDYIVANGVIHVIDNLLDRFDKSPPPPPSTSSASSSSSPTATPTPTANAPASSAPTATPAASSHSKGLSTGAKVGIGIGVAAFGLLILATIAGFLLRHRKQQRESRQWDSQNMSGASEDVKKFYVKRGTIQRQEDLGLGLQSTAMDNGPNGEGDEGIKSAPPYSSGPSRPEIPARSPSRTIYGNEF